MLKTFSLQAPVLLSLQFFLFLLGGRKSFSRMGASPLRFLLSRLVIRTPRSSIVLTLLPFILTEFPLLLAALQRRRGRTARVVRAPLLHVSFASAFSTLAFFMEPRARLQNIVVYTWWRVLEASSGECVREMSAKVHFLRLSFSRSRHGQVGGGD